MSKPNPKSVGSIDETLDETRLGRPSFYEVKDGDTLPDIARRFDTSVEILAAVNDIVDPNRLPLGRVLQVNGHAAATLAQVR